MHAEDENVLKQLNYFISIRKIPNLIFHGSSGTGKRTIVGNFINQIYEGDRNRIKSNVMFVNCAHGKGIKFIRDELKYFAKANMQCNDNNMFKSIVLMNADELTIDAQSALRRCIELFSHNTRFFIIVENKYKLLNPILSRFCEIYIPDKTTVSTNHQLKYTSMHQTGVVNTYGMEDLKRANRCSVLDPELKPIMLAFLEGATLDQHLTTKDEKPLTTMSEKPAQTKDEKPALSISPQFPRRGAEGCPLERGKAE
jgi:replication factor C small subunit